MDRWTYPPFEGKIDGEWIYGRGVADCKNNVIGTLSAVEHLLENGWRPKRTLGTFIVARIFCTHGQQTVLAFGQDEEISGPRGAASIAKHVGSKYGHQGVAMIVDEGGMGLDTIYGNEFALPGIAEKGYVVGSLIGWVADLNRLHGLRMLLSPLGCLGDSKAISCIMTEKY